MASSHPDRTEHFPRIQRQGYVEPKSSSQLTFLEDSSGSDIRELWRDHGNERQRFRNSPPTIGFRRASAENSRTNSPVQKRFEGDQICTPPRMSPASISLDLGSSLDETQLLRDKISRLQQDREHVTTQLSHYRQAAETAQTDLAAEKVATDSLQKELRELKQKLSDKNQQMMEFKCEIEGDKQNAARQTALIQSLRQRVREAEDQAEEKESFVSRNDVTLASLRKELQVQQDRLQQAESSLKHHIAAEEDASKRSSAWESKYGELRSKLVGALHINKSEAYSAAPEALISKVSELAREHQALHSKVSTLTQNLHESNLESKASRETIMRLVSEVGSEKKASDQNQQAMDAIRRERDLLQQRVREAEVEGEKLKVQLASSQEAWGVAKRELDDKMSRLASVENDLQTSEYTGQTSQAQLQNFRRHVAQLLSNLGEPVENQEDQIVTKINDLVKGFSRLKMNSDSLKTQLRNLSDELESQRNLHRTTLKRATEAESRLTENTERVNGLEGELLTSDVERDRLKDDKRKFVAFCEKLARVMKLDEIADDAGLDVNGEAILARGEQLVKLEADALDDRKTAIYNLQRKVKWAKQQIESKELTIGLLRKKVVGLEELVRDKGRVEVERDENSVKFKKILKHNEKLQRELLEYKQQVTILKARLLEASELKVKTLEQYKTIEDLEQAVNKLAKSKQKTALELKEVKSELGAAECETRENKAKSDVTMQQIASELLTTKQALQETRTRERQLLDFRQVLARLLGLDVETLSVPDYEIISRLERLVQAHHAHSITTHSLETSLQDMECGFRAGYDDAVAILRTPSPLKMK